MIQKEKDLLLKDLCARLPYNIIVEYESRIYILNEIDPACKDIEYITVRIQDVEKLMCAKNVMLENIKPYLFPLSSMTDEQKQEYQHITERWMYDSSYSISDSIDWLHKNNFDYRGLIPMGLAINAIGLNIY